MRITPNDIIDGYEHDRMMEQICKELDASSVLKELYNEINSLPEKIESRFEILDL